MKAYQFIGLALLLIGTTACETKASRYETLKKAYQKLPNEWPKPHVDSTAVWQELGVLPEPNYPDGKPSKALIALGKQLFFEPRMSQSKQIACASCHHPDQNFTDNRALSIGNSLFEGNRNAPTVLNLSYAKHLFWDGRAGSLEAQALEPITNPVEMNTSLDTVVKRINNIEGYKKQFRKEFGTDKVTIIQIGKALAAFERSLISRKSKFDYFLLGSKELTERELNGLHLFRTKARCINCHNGPLFTDGQFHNVGLTYYGRKFEDLSRYNVTQKAEDVGKFKTPSLRDVMRTRPWMHNGLFDNMDGIITMYSNGMPQPKPKPEQVNDSLFPKTSPLIKKLNLSKEEILDLKAFLESISAQSFKMRQPKLPE